MVATFRIPLIPSISGRELIGSSLHCGQRGEYICGVRPYNRFFLTYSECWGFIVRDTIDETVICISSKQFDRSFHYCLPVRCEGSFSLPLLLALNTDRPCGSHREMINWVHPNHQQLGPPQTRVKKQETRNKKQNGLAHLRFLVCVTPKQKNIAWFENQVFSETCVKQPINNLSQVTWLCTWLAKWDVAD